MNHFSQNLRQLRLDKGLTQEQAAVQLGVSAQSVSRWETAATFPDVMLLPLIAQLYGVLVDDLFKPSPKGYGNNALRLLAVYERTGLRDDFIAAANEFDSIIRAGAATADDWRSYGVIHEYMMNQCRKKALDCYDRAMEMTRDHDAEMHHRVLRQRILLRCRVGQGEECVREQEAALQSHEDDPAAYVDLAHAQHHAGQHRSALATALAGLARHPQEGLLHLYTGDACRALRQYDEAFRHWQAAVAIDTKFLDAMYSMAFCLEELGRYPEACTVWEDISRSLMQRGLEIEAQWPREMAEKCRRR